MTSPKRTWHRQRKHGHRYNICKKCDVATSPCPVDTVYGICMFSTMKPVRCKCGKKKP